ncbi:MAG: TonB-dependent receptor [Bacteroidetes bacterium]|nr:MAG: TonB-dependent receptor [Bacteroidota bacterium]
MRKLFCFFVFIGLQGISQAIVFQVDGCVIKGKVTDTGGNALPGAAVTIKNTSLGVRTDGDGYYSYSGLKDGTYNLQFSFIGYETLSKEIRLTGEVILNITLLAKPFMTDEVFVSATRAGDHSPLAYSTVNKETISKSNIAQDIPYLLNYTPSLVVSSDAGNGVGYTNINIRGTDVKRINVTIDGIPVNDAESHGVWWVDLPDLASSADNIQIQRGVGTSTNGAGAFGATINFQTANLNQEPYAEANSSYGSFNTSKNTINFGTGLINKKFAVDARLSKIWSDGYIDRAFSDLKSFYISGTMYGESSILKLLIFSGVEHTYQAWYGVPKDSLITNRTYNPYSYKNETDNYWQDNYQLHYSKEINNHLNTNVALHYTKGKGYYENLKSNSKFSSFNLPDAIFNTDTITSSDFITQRWLENDFFGVTYSLNYKKNKINTLIGGGWNKYSGNHFGDIIWAKIITYDGEKYRWYKGTGDKKDLNTFIKINYQLTNSLNLYADLQLRNINYSIGGFDENLKDVTQNHNYNFFNPKAGLLYNLSEKQKVYASFGVSHREPDRGNFTDSDPGKTPKPEKLFDYEAGYEFRSPIFMIKGNLYYMKYIDQLILTGEINNVGAPVLTNVSKSYRQGIELETGIRILKKLNWYGNITLSRNIIPVFADYTDNWDTWSQDKETLKNKTISFSPSIIANSVLDWDPFKNFHVNFNTKYVGKQYVDNTQNSERMLKAYLVQNLSLLYTINNKIFKELTCQFVVNNLFDKKYETNAWVYKYIEGSTQHIMDGYFPQAGTNFMFKIGVKF